MQCMPSAVTQVFCVSLKCFAFKLRCVKAADITLRREVHFASTVDYKGRSKVRRGSVYYRPVPRRLLKLQ